MNLKLKYRPKTLQYHGGKSGGNKAGKWIADMLPWKSDSVYIEPFAGMLGVLMQRAPVKNELVNDLNGDIYNWWMCVRDHPEELARLIALTPRSRQAFSEARELIKADKIDGVRRACALHVVVTQSLMHAADGTTWTPSYSPMRIARWLGEELQPLAERMCDVQIENRDALEILERASICNSAVIYCDPPYRTTECDVYGKDTKGTNWDRMAELLKAQTGKCAVSGYGSEWDMLGWERFELTKGFSVLKTEGYREPQTRTEVLWCNYTPAPRQGALEI